MGRNLNGEQPKHKPRSSSTTRNPLGTKIKNSNSKENLNQDDDWELSCTLEKKTQQIQKNNRNLDN